MAGKEKGMPLREAIRIHLRGFRDVQKNCPQLIPSMALDSVVSAVIPYVTVALSARIVAELAGARRAEVLWRWVVVSVAVGGVLALLRAVFHRWSIAQENGHFYKSESVFVQKAFSMDFADMDRPATHDLRYQITQNQSFNGKGFWALPEIFRRLVESLTGILSAVVLSYELFTLPVPASAGSFTVLNNPLFILVLLGVMVAVSGLSGLCMGRVSLCFAAIAEEGRLGNRIFSHFGGMGYGRHRKPDVRMYEQQELAEHYLAGDNTFTPGGIYDRLCRGAMGVYNGLDAGVSAVFTGCAYVFTCLKAWAGAFGVGEVTQYVGAVTALSGNLAAFFSLGGELRGNGEFLKLIYAYLDIPNGMYQGSLTTEKRSDRCYQVEFRDVSFRYPGTDTWALRHVSVTFRVGQRLAVVGENGSGKTTFIKLLCRLYDPQEGQILLNGIDIRKYSYRDYMDLFSVVFQDFQLLSQSLGANVAGAAEYDRARVERALEDAGFGERLAALPNGLDTQLYKDCGPEGVEISGGEAQKIAIARALYKDAPFLVLDEPTAALDPIAEAEIYSQFNTIAGDRTAVYISHRLSSCRFCDDILVFDRGEIVQRGGHDELVEAAGKYYELWHAQAQYYTEKEA